MKPIKLSLCIPTYNRPAEFKRMLSKVLIQITDDVEIVIRDDSETFESRDIFDELMRDKNIKKQYHVGEKIGLDAASLFLFNNALGEFVWLFSDDDELLDGGIAIPDRRTFPRFIESIWKRRAKSLGVLD
jgi:glycosyltransferase involved in cell wall biosynthesis